MVTRQVLWAEYFLREIDKCDKRISELCLSPVARIGTNRGLCMTTFTVWVDYPNAGVDRVCTYGYSTGGNFKLAERLAAAVDAGVVCTDQQIAKDANGRTYVEHKTCVMGRHFETVNSKNWDTRRPTGWMPIFNS